MNTWEFAKKVGLVGKHCAFFFLLSLIFTMRIEATDCNTNCSDACLTSWRYPCGIGRWCDKIITDPACEVRCKAEKTLSCETGLNFCDLERIANPSQWEQIKGVLQLATDAQAIRSHNHCLDIVSGAGGAVSAVDFLLEWGLPPGVVSLAQHYLSCICGDVDYGDSPNNNDPIIAPGPDRVTIDQAIYDIYRSVSQREPDGQELVWARDAFAQCLSYTVIRAEVIKRAIRDIYDHVYGRVPSEADLAQGFADFEKGLSYMQVKAEVVTTLTRKRATLMLLNQYMIGGF